MNSDIKTKEESTLNATKVAIYTGIIGATIMIGFILLIEFLNPVNSIGFKFMKYIILAIPLTIGLSKLKNNVTNKYRFFQRGILFAAIASVSAAITMLIAYFITQPIDGFSLATITTSMTTTSSETGVTFIPFVAAAMLFLEVFVMSMITSFGVLVYQQDFARTA
jgi:hypothetical protein